ncbi:MAG: chromate reductase [Saprospiraceae bacterium]|jgi:chromate reductase
MVMLSTSPGPGGASSVLASAKGSAAFFGGNVKGSLSVPSFYNNFDMETGKITNSEIESQLKNIVSKQMG